MSNVTNRSYEMDTTTDHQPSHLKGFGNLDMRTLGRGVKNLTGKDLRAGRERNWRQMHRQFWKHCAVESSRDSRAPWREPLVDVVPRKVFYVINRREI